MVIFHSTPSSTAFIASAPLTTSFRPHGTCLRQNAFRPVPVSLPSHRRRCRRLIATPLCSQSDKETIPSQDATKEADAVEPENDTFRVLRKVLAVLSVTGAGETLYLTVNKLFSSPGAICSTEGCLDVLSGPFSSFFGIPLSLFAVLFYSIFTYLCLWPLLSSDQVDLSSTTDRIIPAAEVYSTRDAATRPLMLGLSTALLILSGYLMAVLAFVIRAFCPYCVFSAVISTLIFLLTAFGGAVTSLKPALTITTVSGAVASLGAALSFFLAYPVYQNAQPPTIPMTPPEITLASSQDSLRIAGKLKKKQAKMYGAYWCTHCYDQKQRFGKKAFKRIQYIECDKNGLNSQSKLCREKRIKGYPTWEIDGELYPGEIEIAELERLVDEAIAADAE